MGHKERPVKEGIPMGLLDLLLVAVGLSMDAFVGKKDGTEARADLRCIFWRIPGAYAYTRIYLRRNNSPVY